MDDDERVQPRDTPFMSNEALASDPGGVTIDPARLRQLSPSLFGLGALVPTRAVVRKILEAHLWNGDSRAAVVQVGSRLLTVNTYRGGSPVARDIAQGPYSSRTWSNFHPVIADFVAADLSRVERRKATISEREWERTWELGQDHMTKRPGQVRDGAPHRAGRASS